MDNNFSESINKDYTNLKSSSKSAENIFFVIQNKMEEAKSKMTPEQIKNIDMQLQKLNNEINKVNGIFSEIENLKNQI